MIQDDNRIAQLEDEIRILKAQLEQAQKSIIPSKALNKLFEYGKMVIFYIANDDNLTVKEMSESISGFGYTADEFISGKKTWKDVVFADDINPLREHIINELLQLKQNFEYEYRILTKAGKIRWVFCDFIPDYQNNADLPGFFVKIKDVSKRKDKAFKSELVLKKNISAIRGIFENSTDGIMLIDANGIIQEWSKGYERITGLEKDMVVGRYAWDVAEMSFIKDEKLPVIQKELKDLMLNMQSKVITGTIKHWKTGELRIVNFMHFPVEVPGGRMLGGITRDVTEEIRSQEQIGQSKISLKKSESTIRSIFEYSDDGIVLVDNTGIVREWSKGYEKISGLDKETVIGKLFLWEVGKLLFPKEVQHVEELNNLENELKELVDRMQQKKIVRQIRHYKTGEYRVFNVMYFPVTMPEGMMLGGISRDVTEEVRAIEMLEESKINMQKSENTVRSIFEYSADGIVLVDKNGIIWEWSNGYEKISGLDKDRVIGKLYLWEMASLLFPKEMQPEEELHNLVNELKDLVKRMQQKSIVRQIRHVKTGEHRVFNVLYYPVSMPEGMMLSGISRDVTEEVRALEQLENSQQMLSTEKERLQTLGDNIPNGTLFQFALDMQTNNMFMLYVSAKWETVTGIAGNDVLENVENLFDAMYADDIQEFKQRVIESAHTKTPVIQEMRFNTLENGRTRWLNTWAQPRAEGNMVIWDGIIIDNTAGKETELELDEYRKKLEIMVEERTNELTIANKDLYEANMELNTANEEINTANEELYSTNEALNITNEKLNEINEELAKNESKLRNFIEQSFDGIIIIDDEGHIIEWNHAMAKLTGIPTEEAIGHSEQELLKDFIPDDVSEQLLQTQTEYENRGGNQKPRLYEMTLVADGSNSYLQIIMFPIEMAGKWFFGKIVRNITQQKLADIELEKYQTDLEIMVEEKTAEVFYQQKYLEKLSRRQAIIIKLLQIAQSAENLPQAMNEMLAEIGKYTGVSRVYVFEKIADGKRASCTYEWNNTGISPIHIDYSDVPIEMLQPWMSVFEFGEIINAYDIHTMSKQMADILEKYDIKSILNIPLKSNGIIYGYAGLDDCVANREWDENEIELLKSLAQIISTTTERLQAETSLLLSQSTLRTVMDNITANIYVIDLDTMKIIFANDNIKKVVGREIEGETCWKVLKKDKTDICDFCPKRQYDREKFTKGIYKWELYEEVFDRYYEKNVSNIKWIDGRLVQMTIDIDITERKKAEEALRQSEDMYRQLTIASPNAIVVCDNGGHISFASANTFKLFGFETNADFMGVRLTKFVHKHDVSKALDLFGKLWNDSVHFIPQILLLKNDGSEFIGEISSATVKDANGRISSIIMIIRDITSRIMDETELISAKEKAEESDKLKTAFLANMSHEIRTPINGITGFLQILISEDLSDESKQDYFNEINDSCSRLVNQIENMIDVAKIEANQMTVEPELVSINDLMQEVNIYFEQYIKHKNINKRLTLIMDDLKFIDQCIAYIDPARLRQVINCLIDNAVKFTEKGYVRFGYRQFSADKLEFFVEDTGIGFPPNLKDVIFESFRQAELSNNRLYEGSGLGLTISRGLVQMMGGDIRIESAEGNGSTLYFTVSYLPVAEEDKCLFDEQRIQIMDKNKPFANTSILVVEPEILKYMYYEKLLVAAGFNVLQATNTHQWLKLINQANHIDAALINASTLCKTSDVEVSQIKAVISELPLIIVGVHQTNKCWQNHCHHFAELEEPINYIMVVEAMKSLGIKN